MIVVCDLLSALPEPSISSTAHYIKSLDQMNNYIIDCSVFIQFIPDKSHCSSFFSSRDLSDSFAGIFLLVSTSSQYAWI